MTKRPLLTLAVLIETARAFGRQATEGAVEYFAKRPEFTLEIVQTRQYANIRSWLKKWKGDGLIVLHEHDRVLDAILEAGLPFVDLNPWSAKQKSEFWVGTDDLAIVQLAADHLRERNFKQIAFVDDSRKVTLGNFQDLVARRLAAQEQTCHFYGLPARITGLPLDGQAKPLGAWLHELPKPLGVIAGDDFRGYEVLRVCAAEGIKTPEQVAVIGVGNDELLCNLALPALSSVALDAQQVGREAAALLCAIVEGKKVTAPRRLVPPVGVATRRSTDQFAIDDEGVAGAARFIHQHACEGINVKDVVRAAGVSRRLLESRFREWFDRTPHEEIVRVKLQRVKQLLTGTELTVREIAEQTGFPYVKSMYQAFKAATGQTCGEFRRRCGKQARICDSGGREK